MARAGEPSDREDQDQECPPTNVERKQREEGH